ncbi:hypothetical protein AB9P05_11940 [Roseivirga sp. BDSF3-8]|uniref:hypothetical protein n=1 Tax=Roseivirga sp. BDSF3-8 TaxID=3241598 RepID=UPI003531A2CC
MHIPHFIRRGLIVLFLGLGIMACDNKTDGDDDDDVEHIEEENFEAAREITLDKLDTYLDSLIARQQILEDRVADIKLETEDSSAYEPYNEAISKLERTRVSIREQYGVMQNIKGEEWEKIADRVRKTLEETDGMINGSAMEAPDEEM